MRSAALVASLLLSFLGQHAHAANGNVGLPRYPSISPDGATVVFSFRGDLYRVSSAGGQAVRLTSHPFNDLVSAFSRDGKRIAFMSDRSGAFNLHLMNADGTDPRQLTQTDRSLSLTGFGADDKGKEVLLLDSALEPEWFRSRRPYSVSTAGGEIRQLFGAYGSFPQVSPDGSKVLFNRGTTEWARRGYRGSDNRDVWLYDRKNKSYTRVTSWKGNDGRAKWIDNQSFVFASDREDNTVNLYLLRVGEDEKQARRLTDLKNVDVEEFDIAADAKVLVFAAWDSLHTLNLNMPKATPTTLELRADEDEQDEFAMRDIGRLVTEAALSPDGKTMAYIAYGEVYVRSTEPKSPTRRVTANAARERDLAWSPDGARLYFTSDLTGRDGIYVAKVRLTRDEVKKQVEALRKESPKIIPERTEPEVGDATEPTTRPTTRSATQPTTQVAATQPASTRPAVATTQPSESSRWKEAIAFVVEPFIVTGHQNTNPSPSPDGKYLAFRRGNGHLMLKSLPDGAVREFLKGWSTSLSWRWSPDARHLAYQTEDENYNSDIWIAPVEGDGKPVNITRHPRNDFNPRWSLDGKVLSFVSERVNREYDVWMVYLDKDLEALTTPELDQYYKAAVAAAKKREPLKERPATTRPARASTTSPTTSSTTQLAATRPADTRPADTLPTTRVVDEQRPGRQLDLDDAYLRLRQVTRLAGNEMDNELTPGGDLHVFTATLAGERGVFTIDRDSPAPKRVAGLGGANLQHLSLTGDQLVFVEQGRAGVIKLPANSVEYFDISDRIRVNLRAQAEQKFLEAARIVGTRWYDPNLNGLDWDAVTKRYLDLARHARTDHEFDHVAAKLIGELNGSHLGINTPDPVSPNARPVGRLGIRYEPVDDGLKVTKVYSDGPAGKGPMKLVVGDVITAVDLEPLKGNGNGANQPHEVNFDPARGASTLDALLAGKVGKETIVTVHRTIDDAESREVHLLITPISYAAYADLYYKDWRLATAKKVEEWSAGRIGYIHVQGMNQESLDVFERDLYAAAYGKNGLLIDVRNNGGGSTADRMLASIMAPNHAYTVARGMDPETQKGYPTDRLFISRYTLPINMLCNEKSFSNAEIISHAFKTLRRGTLVGQQTAGGVISTGGTTLIDGTLVRIPFRGWHLPDGTNMELHGATPDLLIEQTPDHETHENDQQLRAAVDDLLKRLH